MNKLEELRIRSESESYDILAVTETWADSNINDAELQLTGYTSFRVDRTKCKGGGVILYVKNDLQASMCQQLTEFGYGEAVWSTVKLRTGQLLVGVCYRSPNSTADNNDMLLRLLDQAVNVGHVTHFLVMGDFNCPSINYEDGYVNPGGDAFDTEFYDKTLDLMLVQNVFDCTRMRSGSKPSKLDYVFTDEEHLIETVHYEAPLGKSDHVALTWNLVVEPEERKSSDEIRYNYWSGNYGNMIEELQAVDWEHEFRDRDANGMWQILKEKLQNAVVNHVPLS